MWRIRDSSDYLESARGEARNLQLTELTCAGFLRHDSTIWWRPAFQVHRHVSYPHARIGHKGAVYGVPHLHTQ